MTDITLGIFAKTFHGDTPEAVLRAAKDAGFAAVQYNMACSGLPSMPDEVPAGTAQAVAQAAQAVGVEISALSATYNMIHPDRAKREAGHRRLRILAAAAVEMNTDLLTLCTGTRDPDDQWAAHPDNDTPEAWDDLLESMAVAVAIADEFDLNLGVEPELANVINSAAKARTLIDTMGSNRIKIVLDPANLFEVETAERQREIVREGIDLLAPDIVLAHAKDRAADGSFLAAGKGVLDYDHYLGCLRRTAYNGPLITHGLAADEAEGVARFLTDKLTEDQPA